MEYSSSSYSVSFCGRNIETTVTNKASVADHWLHDNILQNRKPGEKTVIIGLDCKFKPHTIRSMSNKIATLQVCIDTKCLILQLLHMDSVPLSLKNYLLNDNAANNIRFFGIKVNENASKLWSEYGIRCSENYMVDIRGLVKIWFPVSYRGEPSLKSLADRVAGISRRKRKKDCVLDWETRVLDEELVEFACADAYACYMIAHKLIKESI